MHFLGTDSGNSAWYLFYSGVFGVLVFALGSASNAYVTARKHNCHIHGCWHIGRHLVEGTPYTVCRRHDPSGKVSEADVRRKYHVYLGERPGRG